MIAFTITISRMMTGSTKSPSGSRKAVAKEMTAAIRRIITMKSANCERNRLKRLFPFAS